MSHRRRQLAPVARRMEADGRPRREIAAELGVKLGTLRRWLAEPEAAPRLSPAQERERKRRELPRARRMAAAGKSQAEIARTLGVRSGTISNWLAGRTVDWRRYEEAKRGVCESCGRPTSRGRTRCAMHRVWTDEQIILAIRAWVAEHGRPPTADEWRRLSDTEPNRPNTAAVCTHFGGWNVGLEAADVEPRNAGQQGAGAEERPG